MTDAQQPATEDGREFDSQIDRSRKQLERFLSADEPLSWVGAPQLARLILRALYRTALMALVGSVGLYLVYFGITPEDICGVDASRYCKKLYVWPIFGLAVATIYTPFLWLGLFLHASGLLFECYGLTDARALKLRANPFDRFQSVKFSRLTDRKLALQRRFGTLAFGPVAFLCLSDKDADAVRQTPAVRQPVEQPRQAGLASDGARP